MAILPKQLVSGVQLGASMTPHYVASGKARIDAMAITNTSAGAETATLHLVPPGGSAVASNCVLSARSIAPGETYIVPGAVGQWLESGGAIHAVASTAATLSLMASGVEYTA